MVVAIWNYNYFAPLIFFPSPIIEPARHRDDPHDDRPPAQAGDSDAALVPEVVAEHDDGGDAQGHQEEGVEGRLQEAEVGAERREQANLEG